MGLLKGLLGGGDEHHEIPCPARDDGGPSWIRRDQQGKPNPMGWGSDVPRVVKRAGEDSVDADSRARRERRRT